MKKLSLFVFILLLASYVHGQKLWGIVMADTDDPSIGKSCNLDYVRVNATFNTIANAIGYSSEIMVIRQTGFTQENLVAKLAEIKCGAQDIILFYYSGHGENVSGDFPAMNIQQDKYSLEGVHKQLKQKGAKLVISIGDCCNVLSAPASAERGFKVVSVEDAKTQNYKNLFAEQSGDIIIASSSKGECAVGNNEIGGFWTHNFLQSLTLMVNYSSHPSWQQLLEDTKVKLAQLNKSQTPIAMINLGFKPVVVVQDDLGDINKYLAKLKDPTLNRKALRANYTQYFVPNSRVDIYVDSVMTDVQPIERFLDRVYVNASKIEIINLIQTKSQKKGKIYERITVQEIWKQE